MTAVRHALTLSEGELALDVSAASDRGHVRSHNEDSVLASPPVFLVADGMGGHSFGDRASRAVVDAFTAMAADATGLPTPETVLDTIREANATIVERSATAVGRAVSGTTLAGVALVTAEAASYWMAFNIGDSRVYRWDGRALEQLTVDHSAVQELLDGGAISALEALEHPHRNVITRAVGVSESVDADVWMLPLRSAEFFLVCSDGLTRELGDDQIAAVVAERHTLPAGESLADRLVQAALAAGGSDNVSVVTVEAALVGTAPFAEETNDRGVQPHLEDTRPRK